MRGAPGAHLAYAAVACAFVTAMGVLSPMEGDEPRAYQSVLYVASVALFIDVVAQLSRVLGADERRTRRATATWVLAAVAAFALAFATRRNSAVCTLLGSLAGGPCGDRGGRVDLVAERLRDRTAGCCSR